MKEQQAIRPRGLSVHKLASVFLISMVVIFSCKTAEKNIGPYEYDDYKIDVLKRKSEHQKSIILFKYYDYNKKSKKIPFHFVIINGFIFTDNPVEIYPKDGKIDILISDHLKNDIKINGLKVSNGDSLILNAYLRDSNTIFE